MYENINYNEFHMGIVTANQDAIEGAGGEIAGGDTAAIGNVELQYAKPSKQNISTFHHEFARSRRLTYKEIRQANERASQYRQRLLRRWDGPLIGITLNIPGAFKRFPLATLCFKECRRITEITMRAAGVHLLYQDTKKFELNGEHAYFLAKGSPERIKEILCEIEDTHPLGRIFNLDVYKGGESIGKLTRNDIGKTNRGCLLCDSQALDCVFGRRHGIEEVINKTLALMWEWIRKYLTEHVITSATRALCDELATTPKPGLVDRHNCGSHSDMDFFTYIDSIAELLPFFQECALIGFDCAVTSIEKRSGSGIYNEADIPELLPLVKRAGKLANIKMSLATGGVNTHRGIICSLGILCAAYGWLIRSKTVFSMDELFDLSGVIARPLMDDFKDMSSDTAETNGEKLFAMCGMTGVRGEMSCGYRNVREYSLPMLRRMIERGHPMNDSGVAAFLALLSHVDDTTIVHRSNEATLREIQRAAAEFLKANPSMSEIKRWAAETDLQFIEQNISAGGCADLLAITFFVWYLF